MNQLFPVQHKFVPILFQILEGVDPGRGQHLQRRRYGSGGSSCSYSASSVSSARSLLSLASNSSLETAEVLTLNDLVNDHQVVNRLQLLAHWRAMGDFKIFAHSSFYEKHVIHSTKNFMFHYQGRNLDQLWRYGQGRRLTEFYRNSGGIKMPRKMTFLLETEVKEILNDRERILVTYSKFNNTAQATIKTVAKHRVINLINKGPDDQNLDLVGESKRMKLVFHAKISKSGDLGISHLARVYL